MHIKIMLQGFSTIKIYKVREKKLLRNYPKIWV